MSNKKENRLIPITLTTIVCGLVLICMIFFGMYRHLPPPPEYGVEVNLGNSEDGMGNDQPMAIAPAEAYSAPRPSASDYSEDIVTTNNDNVISAKVNKKPKQDKPKPTENVQTQPVEEKPAINPNAFYTGRKVASTNNTEGGNEGITGKPGDQGVPDGTPGASNYSGTPGKGGTSGGVGFSLAGRSSKSLAKPNYNSDEQGKVVVKIWVNPEGQVVRAQAGEKGTTTADATLWRMSEQAALKSSFSPKKDASDMQVGTITYHFVKLN